MNTTSASDLFEFRHVDYAWNEEEVANLNPLERLVYRSNRLGSDQRITNTGGGNTSSKAIETDPLTGEEIEVLWVKGSGGDLRTSTPANFASLYLDKLLALRALYDRRSDKGPKSRAEDDMVDFFRHCTFALNPRASSIDTPLHGFLPAKHVDHMHPNSVIAVAATRRSEELTREVFGGEVGWLPWLRPGFELGLAMRRAAEADPSLKGLVMAQHGVISWADDDKECYDVSVSLIEKAARYIEARDRGEATFGGQRFPVLEPARRDAVLVTLLPWLRGRLSQTAKMIATVQCDEGTLRFVNSHDAQRLAELGTSCPDHFLRTKIKPLYVAWDPDSTIDELKRLIDEGLPAYRRDYTAYYEACKHPDSPPMRDPNPTVILIPGVGMITWGKTKSESRVTAEFYNCAVEVMRGAEAIDEYIALPQQEAFDIEYWRLEEAKLRRMPTEKELARQIVVVIGAGSGIGKAMAHRFAGEGAHVVCADRDLASARATADELTKRHGQGIGVGGTGISACGPAIAVGVDVTNPDTLECLVRDTVLAYGGIDHLVVTAGVFLPPDTSGRNSLQQWRTTFDVNVVGVHQAVDAWRATFATQDLPGSVVITTSVNAVVGKKGSLAYDASKAAANHLVRELAIELAPHVRVNAVAPATVVQGSTMFPRDRVIASLTKYGIPFEESMDTEVLRTALASFYAQRTLLQTPITPDDQAEAAFFLVSRRSAKTTGQVINVDGGLHEAFLR
ncbi:MAG: bifunctional rhamnulose-1-phosphate aldolase/short-chain dehydrogenase [Planctomycetes bacterium]|nr:bifunctional rhamnulose-1-phosphate aldolase/short-chain dehydrogenase [Planctomycetota bacterium]MCB9891792.1 bifunctional rhamnulose-1-phosphate aldolase/short-chain dehydrogenase [Planctomycetota bacterium]